LFHHKAKNFISISDNIKEIINNLEVVELNQQSILEYLNFGYKIGNKTHIKEIYEYEAANKYEVDTNLIIKGQNYWNLLEKNEKISNEKFRELFNNQHKKALNLGGKLSLPLTGGRDTRTILSTYMNDLEKISAYTHGPEYHTDIKLAKKICSTLKIPHKTYVLDNEWFKNMIPQASVNTGIFNGLNPFFDYVHVISSLEKEQNNAEIFVSGILGNQLYRNHPFGNNTPNSMEINNISEFIIRNVPSVLNFKANLNNYYENLFNGFSTDEIRGQIKKSVEIELLKANGAVQAIDYLQYFLFSSYSSNMASNSLKLTGKYFKVIGSFFHKDLLQQIRLLNINERTNASVQNFIISQNSNYLYKLPYFNTGRVVKYAKLIINKLSAKITGKNLFYDPNLVNYPYWLRKYHKDFLLATLNYDQMKLKKLFNKKEFNILVNKFIENKSSFRNKKTILFNFSLDKFIINLLSLELWLKNVDKIK